MSEPFAGEIRMFAGNFAPRGWAFCDGQLLAVSQNDALFSLLGTIYGGDGRTTFALPELRGRLPMHAGVGPGLSSRRLGTKSGSEKVTVTLNQMASHGHAMQGSKGNGTDANPKDNVLAGSSVLEPYYNGSPTTQMASASVSSVGGAQSHTNVMPFLCIHFIIALFGIYPSRH